MTHTERKARRVRTSAPFLRVGLARSESKTMSNNIAIDPTSDLQDDVSIK